MNWRKTLQDFRFQETASSKRSPSPSRGMAQSEAQAPSMTAMEKGIASILQEIRDMRSDIAQKFEKIDQRVDKVEDRLLQVETYQSSSATQEMGVELRLAALEKRDEERSRQMDDFENRERRNNLRIFGVPEVEGETERDITRTVRDIITLLFSEEMTTEPTFDRVHRAGGRAGGPRSILVRFHYYSEKTKVLEEARKAREITYNNAQITIFQDLSAYTLAKRRMCRPLTLLLKEKGIRYRWGYPFSLTFEYMGQRPTLITEDDIRGAIQDYVEDSNPQRGPSGPVRDTRRGPGPSNERRRKMGARKYRKMNTPSPVKEGERNAPED